MIKVTLLGDSIRLLGYGNLVPELLGEEFEVYQPDENCQYAKRTLRGLVDWKDGMEGSRIVHWNNGIWDIVDALGDGMLFTSEEEYTENILRIADILLKKYDKVIFATTTPARPGHENTANGPIVRYNALVVPKLQEKGIIINDLHSLVAEDTEKYICDDLVHLTEEGAKVCAEQVAKVIKAAAEDLSTN